MIPNRPACESDLRFLKHPTRRHFLAGATALGAAALLRGSLPGQQGPAGTNASGWIDVHHHFSPPSYAKVSEQKKVAPAIMAGWSVEKTIADMDQAGVSTAMNSIVVPGVWFGEKEEARRLARECNEYGAELGRQYPGRFGSFATLPIPDMDGSLLEIAYALDTLKADGFMLFTSYADKWLGDPIFAPVFEELNRRSAVVFVHPTNNACCTNLLPGISSAEIEYGTDTTRAIVRMVYSGSAKLYPNIRFIFSHGGGTMPYLIGRFVNRVARPAGAGGGTRQDHDFQAEIGKFFYDTAQTFHPVPMEALKHVVPMSQILFGTDYPYRSSLETTRGLIASNVFNPAEIEAIKRGNVLKILPQWNKAGEPHAALAWPHSLLRNDRAR